MLYVKLPNEHLVSMNEKVTFLFVWVSHLICFVFCVQDLLQLQYEGVAVMKMFDKAKVNVNLLIFLLNKKFYGKWGSEEEEGGGSDRRWETDCAFWQFVEPNEFSEKTSDGAGLCFVSDSNLMDHTKMKCYCPTKCTCSVLFHVVIVNVTYF